MNLFDRSIQERTELWRKKNVYNPADSTDPMIDFSSTDFLGLNTAGRHTFPFEHVQAKSELEELIAAIHNSKSVLLFPNGHLAEVALCSSLPDSYSTVLYDEYCSPGMKAGITLSASPNRFKFKHNNLWELESMLAKYKHRTPIIFVEALYGITGDFCPIEEVANMAFLYNATLVVNESYSAGIFGNQGSGLVCKHGLEEKVFARLVCLENAYGISGGAVLGCDKLKGFLLSASRDCHASFLSRSPNYGEITQAYKKVSHEECLRKELKNKIEFFEEHQRLAGQKWTNMGSPIKLLHAGPVSFARSLLARLNSHSLAASLISPSLMFKGNEYLRVSLHAHNTFKQIALLLEAVAEAHGRKYLPA